MQKGCFRMIRRRRIYPLTATLALSMLLSACGGGGVPTTAPNTGSSTQTRTSATVSSYATLELAAGILTIAGSKGTRIASGVNVVSTFRHGGNSAVLVD